MHHMKRFVSTCCLLILCIGLFSCGAGGSGVPREKVSGKVTLNGEALDNAIIIYESASGDSSHGVTDAEGHYEMKSKQDEPGVPVGSYVVRIIKTEGEVAGQELIPAKYNASSELKADVKTGDNQFDFEIQNK